jgi:hypothetical protein
MNYVGSPIGIQHALIGTEAKFFADSNISFIQKQINIQLRKSYNINVTFSTSSVKDAMVRLYNPKRDLNSLNDELILIGVRNIIEEVEGHNNLVLSHVNQLSLTLNRAEPNNPKLNTKRKTINMSYN